jgi:hypothetical protein
MLNISSSSLGFERGFFNIFYKHKGKNNDPPWAWPILTPGLLFEQSW